MVVEIYIEALLVDKELAVPDSKDGITQGQGWPYHDLRTQAVRTQFS